MPQWHGDSRKRKPTGGRRKAFRGKRAYEMGSEPTETIVGETKLRKRRGRGGSSKVRLLTWNYANVTDPATGKTQKVEIKRVTRNPANPDYQRRGVITRGAVIETSLGQATVVSRPGQDGTVNAILTQKA
ncbi:30S ribosomal protein S8e [Candidatus Bathyarchaeota archaeon]|nr:30S ribosomal protein S8e [Candidatus Bathyarchaeota archaeon]